MTRSTTRPAGREPDPDDDWPGSRGWLSGRTVALLLSTFVGASLLLFLVGPAAALRRLAPETPLLDVTPGYGASDVHEVMLRYGESGRGTYQLFLALDFLYGAIYAVALAAALLYALRVLRLRARGWRLLALVPVLAGLLDWVENALLLLMTRGYPERVEQLAPVTSAITSVKLPLVNLSLLLTLFALLALLARWARGRIGPRPEAP